MTTYSDPNPPLLTDGLAQLPPITANLAEALAARQDFLVAAITIFDESLASGLWLGGAGDDTVRAGIGNHILAGFTGNDSLHGGAGWNLLIGGEGDDVLDVRWASDPERGGLSYGDWSGAKRASSDWLFGGAGNDALFGSFAADLMHGGTGNDTLDGQDGDDILFGGAGNDLLEGDAGRDVLSGAAGRDTLDGGLSDDLMSGGDGNDRLNGGNGNDTMDGGTGNDTIYGGFGDDSIQGGTGNDWVDTGGGDDIVDLGDGNDFVAAVDDFGRGDDVLLGRAGNDTLHGGRGNDMLDGGDGDDVLNGGAGDDFLTGGSGADVFQFRSSHGTDIIADFGPDDRLVLTSSINGETIDLASLADRMLDLGDATLLDLGNGNGAIFLNQDPDTLAQLLQTRIDFW